MDVDASGMHYYASNRNKENNILTIDPIDTDPTIDTELNRRLRFWRIFEACKLPFCSF